MRLKMRQTFFTESRKKRKKANSVTEYAIVIFLAAVAFAGVFFFLKRHVQARVKAESDRYIGHGHGLEWETNRLTITNVDSRYHRHEQRGGDMVVSSDTDTDFTTLTAPVPSFRGFGPMMHKQSTLHVQDPALPAPSVGGGGGGGSAVDNPSHEGKQETHETEPVF
ncbi:MAG: hypothetical protein GF333_08005 [Candidatus Omnitrophica bacterium]|nr:hypothetical protein [Candidatus Omnitrophota bacterium]